MTQSYINCHYKYYKEFVHHNILIYYINYMKLSNLLEITCGIIKVLIYN